MKYLGLDYGSKRIGIAVSDEGGTIAFPRAVIGNDGKALAFIGRMLREEKVGEIVMGDTRAIGGMENPVTKEAEGFIEKLARTFGVPVSRAFEGWSSIEASRYAPQETSHDDSSAAAVILQRFLDMRGSK